MQLKRCLVLGGRGFLGWQLTKSLVSKGVRVRVLDRALPAGVKFDTSLVGNELLEIVDGDFGNLRDLERAMADCDACVHAITTTLPKTSNENVAFDVSTNLLGTIKALDHAARMGVKKLIFLSSGGTVYGVPQKDFIDEEHPTDPISSYGITKLAIEKYLMLYEQLHGIKSVSLRLSNPYGPGQRVDGAQGAVAVFIGAALRREQVEIWGRGDVVRDYVYVGDVVDAIGKALYYEGPSQVINIGSGVGRSLLEVIQAIEFAAGVEVSKLFHPARSFDVPRNVLAIEKAGKILGWKPSVQFEDGVKMTVGWARSALDL